MYFIEDYDVNTIIFKQQANSKEYFASLLPNALYDGSVAVHEPSHIECAGSGRLRNI